MSVQSSVPVTDVKERGVTDPHALPKLGEFIAYGGMDGDGQDGDEEEKEGGEVSADAHVVVRRQRGRRGIKTGLLVFGGVRTGVEMLKLRELEPLHLWMGTWRRRCGC